MQIPTQAGARLSAAARAVKKQSGYQARALVIGITFITAAGLIPVLAVGPARAATQDSPPGNDVGIVSGQAALPPAGITGGGGPSLCPIEPQLIDAEQYNPQVGTAADGSPIVEDVGVVDTTDAGCGDSVTFYLETKVCGWLGCSWNVIDQATYNELPTDGQLVSRLLTAPLRAGTNRYRVRTEVTTYTLEAEDEPGPGIIGVVPEVEEDIPAGVQLSNP